MRFPEYPRTLDSVHSGLCIPHCPTHGITGREADSPRGRIYLMRGWSEGALELTPEANRHLDQCIVCRACESVCPSGISMTGMMESFRSARRTASPPRGPREAALRFFLRHVLPRRDRIAALTDALELHQRSGARRVVGAVLGALAPGLARLHDMQPTVPARRERRLAAGPDSVTHPAEGTRRARVGLFLGCIASEWFAPLHRATIRVLVKQGVEVVVPREQTCCGALHRHAGLLDDAAALFDRNLRVFREAGVDAIVVNAAGCGAALKEPLPGRAAGAPPATPPPATAPPASAALPAAAPPVRDVSEFLHGLGLVAPMRALPLRVTIDQPCHLVHGQRIGPEIVEGLLARIPELTVVPLPGSERCCGAGGIYNLLHPEMAEPILDEKVDAIRGSGARVLVTSNPGCAMHIARGLARSGLPAFEGVHPVELLNRALAE